MVNSEELSQVEVDSRESSETDDASHSLSLIEVLPSETVRTLSSESSSDTTAVRMSSRGGTAIGMESPPVKGKRNITTRNCEIRKKRWMHEQE